MRAFKIRKAIDLESFLQGHPMSNVKIDLNSQHTGSYTILALHV